MDDGDRTRLEESVWKKEAGLLFFIIFSDIVEFDMREHYTNPAIQKAFGVLKTISADEETRRLAEMREDALRNEVSMLNAAKRDGKKEGEKIGRQREKEETVRNLTAMGGLSIVQISQATGLSLDEVRALQNENKAETS